MTQDVFTFTNADLIDFGAYLDATCGDITDEYLEIKYAGYLIETEAFANRYDFT